MPWMLYRMFCACTRLVSSVCNLLNFLTGDLGRLLNLCDLNVLTSIPCNKLLGTLVGPGELAVKLTTALLCRVCLVEVTLRQANWPEQLENNIDYGGCMMSGPGLLLTGPRSIIGTWVALARRNGSMNAFPLIPEVTRFLLPSRRHVRNIAA